MAKVYIPSLLQDLTGGQGEVEAAGTTVREVIRNLDKVHPRIAGRLIDNGQLRANISVAVDGEITPLGLLEQVGENSEIHFVAAIKGGLSEPGSVAKAGDYRNDARFPKLAASPLLSHRFGCEAR